LSSVLNIERLRQALQSISSYL